MLKKQYRMNEEILSITNQIIYDGKIEHGSEEVKTWWLETPNKDFKPKLNWMRVALNPNNPVVFLNTDHIIKKLSDQNLRWMKNKNFVESAVVNMLVTDLIFYGVDLKDIGIITPFLDQSVHLEKLLQSHLINEIYTIDKS